MSFKSIISRIVLRMIVFANQTTTCKIAYKNKLPAAAATVNKECARSYVEEKTS